MTELAKLVIGIIECGQTRSDWLEEHGEMADPFPPFLKRTEPSLTFKVYKAHKGELPQQPQECDAWLITGSPHSVCDRFEWQENLAAFLAEAVKHRPVVGICYGHQLLHDALGGSVGKSAKGWGIGVQQYPLQEVPDWAPTDQRAESVDGFRLIALHQDQVTQAAPGSRVLAGNEFCPLGVTTIGDNVFTIQAHPEMTRKLARSIYEEQRQQQGDALTDQAQQSLDAIPIDDDLAGQWIVAFIRHRLTEQLKPNGQ